MADDDVMKANGANTHTISRYESGASGYTRGPIQSIIAAERAAAIKEYKERLNTRQACLKMAITAARSTQTIIALAEDFYEFMRKADSNG